MAPASPDVRRRGPGGGLPRPRPGPNAPSRSDSPRWLWAVVAGVLLLALFMLYKARAASSSTLNTSGTPGAATSGSAAQEPTGGASSVPGQLPPFLVSQPDALQEQVQRFDTSSAESPQALNTPTSSVSGIVNNPSFQAALQSALAPPTSYVNNPGLQSAVQGAVTPPISSVDSGNVTGHGFV